MDWIERYIDAVARRLPQQQRGAAEQDLRSMIDGLAKTKAQGGIPTDEDIRAVLQELGHPRKMADKYRGRRQYMISPDYFDLYWLILRIVLLAVGGATLLALVIQIAIQPPSSFGAGLGSLISGIWQALLSAFAMVTIIFALNERFNPQAGKWAESLDKDWKVEDLPPAIRPALKISKSDPIVAIIFTLIFAVLLNTNPDLFGLYFKQNDTLNIVPLFSPRLTGALLWINFSLICTILLESVKLAVGHWTILLAGLQILLKIPGLLVGVWLFSDDSIFNTAFFQSLETLFHTGGAATAPGLPGIIRKVIIAVIIIGFLADGLTAVIKAGRILLKGKK